jgi:hypothetical protein
MIAAMDQLGYKALTDRKHNTPPERPDRMPGAERLLDRPRAPQAHRPGPHREAWTHDAASTLVLTIVAGLRFRLARISFAGSSP